MSLFSRGRRSVLAGIALVPALALAACGGSGSSSAEAGGTTDIKVVLGWYANSESGGYYAAQDEGLYADHNVDVTIQQGGPNVAGTTIVASGKAEMGIGDAASVALAQEQGIPIVTVAAIYQDNPVGVLVHSDSGMDSFDDMENHTWMVQTGNTGAEYMQKEKGLTFKTQAYQGSIANFLDDKSLVQQGWPTNEQYQALKAGVETKFFSYASAGYNPYNDVIFTSKSYLEKNPQAVKDFLAASMQGWSDYMGDVDVATSTNEQLMKVNPEQTSDALWYAWDKQRDFIATGDGEQQIGAMSSERWSTLVDQLTKLGVLTKEIDPADLFDNSYLPTVPAPSTLPDAPADSY
ncbi:ABC transporter substrate-binding protein [Kineosporia sp. J2-2]|uniref:Thiamine pyrimidine synthase n=1 Tax=Kineosporia corallincola TaxID=2835133 RepID=A0ABS5TSE6_9ACTN|nr:ABC transporter substrate-binding protein [Kineosporia corallincola]MBT0773706.1 ABC transporter substrate-binding protein [Kineosporia corallincola]